MNQSFHTKIHISIPIEKAFHAIRKKIYEWWTEDLEQIDERTFRVKFSNGSFWTIKEVNFQPPEQITWKVTESHHIFSSDKTDEWNNTAIKWLLIENSNSTTIQLSHIGLAEELDCYHICSKGWQFFLNSLKQYLETGIGKPHQIRSKTKPSLNHGV
ncbi:SRPBCC family protein [Reichenbachiella versicolor]|uniref:SRPBCC family protein n=1 Tax=Reichenbachiella versicolor TaxID=1821036 RepID=UPI000D6E6CF7|nr:SRPBCC domain-containing protein [Reichenbachiella versicolor]